jgi:glycosyltransferase involved in cell wall biosynthesis
MSGAMNPLFSVVVPTYNRANETMRAIESVLAQDLPNFELIIVDDGSSDDTIQRVSAITDPRLRLVSQANAGASAARNLGIDLAHGLFVAFLDSDDVYLPNHLSNLLPLLEPLPFSVAYSQVVAFRGRGRSIVKPFRAVRKDEPMALYLICDRGFVQTSGLALSREMAMQVRYRTDVSFGDDTDFAIRLQMAGCRFRMTDQPSVVWTDVAAHGRMSAVRHDIGSLQWLDDLRPHIPEQAYFGYKGWHFAKYIFGQSRRRAARAYFDAVRRKAYSPRLALIVFLQIFLSDRTYRLIADGWIWLQGQFRSQSYGPSIPVDEPKAVARDGGSVRHAG